LLWRCCERLFDLDERTLVMGVVNVTPDSFSDGGRYADPAAAIAHARDLLDQGADLIDVGAESTRPGAEPVPPEMQWERLAPVLSALGTSHCVSVDTADAEVARRALAAGASVVNDVTALGDPAMAGAISRHGAGVVLMHMRGIPATMQEDPRYGDVSVEVAEWLGHRIDRARAEGIDSEAIAIDPGIGFGKGLEHNLELIARLDSCVALGRPVAVGLSRKGFIGRTLELPVDQRLEGCLAAAAIAVFQGARIVRTHDVRATVRAVRMADALRKSRTIVGGPHRI
jgi:dihydropteroate synthase